MNNLLDSLRGGLIVSCQAPDNSPLNDPGVISAMALAAQNHGAVAVRINGEANIRATRERVTIPIIGIEKVVTPGYPVYITPTFEVAARLRAGGADIIATDGTSRPRPQGEKIEDLISRIQGSLGLPVMADIATYDEGLFVADWGADIVATTLCGYTEDTRQEELPALHLVNSLSRRLETPVICEGGVATPRAMAEAFAEGAFAVVVGTAITGIDRLLEAFIRDLPARED
ncbi:MAG: putative N-acetylmannosamine-6-phosphate 2-epimerase [Acidobacteria bacterium]|nr:putative N-acetylmannosamine-6-phosphate 2-epimerase [Acidobacteriota bacterium]